jgi:valyl-tRNA synthetase
MAKEASGKDGGQAAAREPRLRESRWARDMEQPIRKGWKDSGLFRFRRSDSRPIFSIDTPPPYVNAPVHIGHTTTYTIMDFIARFKRMQGFNVLFPLGLDRNGLPIEMAAEKRFGISIRDTPREEFIRHCRRMLEESSLESLESFFKLGHSYNSWTPGDKPGDMYYTDSYSYRALTQATFVDLWNKGLVYTDDKVNNYCTVCRTTLADAEIVYKDIESEFVHVRWKVRETGETIVIATTRPELLCTCAMVLFNPGDERYKHLEGRTAVVPLYGIEVPIRAHPYAKPDQGTGLVMMCSFGDYTDVRFFREMGLTPTYAIDAEGRMNESAGFLRGLTVKEARKDIRERLLKEGLIERTERTLHRTPTCERSKNPIEFIAMPEYYLKQLDLRKDMQKLARKTRFFRPSSRQILLDWIDSLTTDWPVSRRRYYATEIPLWYCSRCREPVVPPKGKYYKPWKEPPPVDACPKCGGKEFRGEDRVFDTWFDSSISPLYVLGYLDKGFFGKAFPCSLRPQGKEIVRTWLYYTLLRCYQLTGRSAFQNVWIHFHVLDEKGTKMSKSLGNVIDPLEIDRRFGAEPFRAWCALEGNITNSDMRCSFERIEGCSKFLTKLWNVARFISMFDRPDGRGIELTDLDRLVLSEANGLVGYAAEHYGRFDFHKPATRMRNFVWETFASNYLELVKGRAYNHAGSFTKGEQNAAVWTLHKVLETCLLVLHPINPFITSKIYGDVWGEPIEGKRFPEPDERMLGAKLPFTAADLQDLNGRIWKSKKDAGLSLRAGAGAVTMPHKFRSIEKDVREAHHISEVRYGPRVSVSLSQEKA